MKEPQLKRTSTDIPSIGQVESLKKSEEHSFFFRSFKALTLELFAIWRIAGPKVVGTYLLSLALNYKRVIRQRTVAPAFERLAKFNLNLKFQKLDIRVPGTLFGGCREMYIRGVYWPNSKFFVKEGDTVVDLGANQGLFTLYAAKAGAQVFSVEGQSKFLPLIEQLLRLNGCSSNFTLINSLVGNTVGVFSNENQLTSASHFGGLPPRVSMDELVNRYQLSKIDFLKMDIEGSEFGVFSESLKWLKITKRIAMELHSSFGSPQKIVFLLKNAGFDVAYVDNNYEPQLQPPWRDGYIYAIRP